MPATEFTSINRGWSMKMLIFIVVLVGFGTWGLLDAAVWYPQRGIDDASYKQLQYLEIVAGTKQYSAANIPDPKARLQDLRSRKAELDQAAATALSIKPDTSEYRELMPKLIDLGARNWLESLRLVGRLDAQNTVMESPAGKLSELRQKWNTTNKPNPLSEFDIPLQWLFALIGYGLGLYLLWITFRVFRTRYGWDPAIQELTLPGGKAFVPADIAEFDKRKWDKFYVTINLKAGSSHKLDLLRFVPLEDWVLAMERTAFPETAPPLDETPSESSAPTDGEKSPTAS